MRLNKKWYLFTFLFLNIISPLSAAKEAWKWNELMSTEAKQFIDPLARLSSIQRYDLMIIANFQKSPESEALKNESKISLKRFEDANIDILTLMKQSTEMAQKRQKSQLGINKLLLGQSGKIAGYIVPLEFENNQLTQFLLVGTAGACIHTPPPAANQIILVNYPQGFELVGLYTPVWIEGTLQAESNNPEVQLSDGEIAVNTAYSMNADKVSFYN